MKKFYAAILCLVFLCLQAQLIFAQDAEEKMNNEQYEETQEAQEIQETQETQETQEIQEASEPDDASPETKSGTIKRFLIASGETLLTNLILLPYNIGVKGTEGWALPTKNSIYNNFTKPWIWEEGDSFLVNHLGHAYHGAYYFSAGRANEFNFYQSVFFTMLGSSSWEAFGENAQAALNDFFSSSIGGMSIGEMLYRIYCEANSAGVPAFIAFLINPVAGFHRLVTKWEPPDYGRNTYQFQTYLGLGYANIDYSLSGSNDTSSFKGVFAELGFSIIYGNPFLQESSIPYEHFELFFSAGTHIGKYTSTRLVSDGYLLSFCPIDTDANMMSTGLSLHLDFISQRQADNTDGTIDHYNNSLDWSVKYQHLFSEDFSFQIKCHAGFTFFGASKFAEPESNLVGLKNYGTGFNEKLYFILDHKKLGKAEASVFHYVLWSYPRTSRISKGTVNFLFADLTYSYPIIEHLSVGINGFFAWERGHFSNFSDSKKSNKAAKVFVAWNL